MKRIALVTFAGLGLLRSPARAAEARVLGAVVTSEEWVVRRAPEKEEEFIGNVSYKSAGTALRADWALFAHATQDWKARGEVDVRRRLSSGDLIIVTGDEARFNQRTRKGTVTAERSVGFKRVPAAGEPDEAQGARLDFEGEERAVLAGAVRIRGPRLMAACDRAEYSMGELVLTGGRPVVLKLEGEWTGAVKADRVAARRDPRSLAADGRAKGWILLPEGARGRRP